MKATIREATAEERRMLTKYSTETQVRVSIANPLSNIITVSKETYSEL